MGYYPNPQINVTNAGGRIITAINNESTLVINGSRIAPPQAAPQTDILVGGRLDSLDLQVKAGQMFQPIRVAVCGRKNAPPLFETLAVLGRETCLHRIGRAIEQLERDANPAEKSS